MYNRVLSGGSAKQRDESSPTIMSEPNRKAELFYSQLYADPDCEVCGGEGVVVLGVEEVCDCVCVSTGRNEAHAEMLSDLIRGN